MQDRFIGFFLHLACMFDPKYGLCKGKVLLYYCFLCFFCVKFYRFITASKTENIKWFKFDVIVLLIIQIKQSGGGYEKTLNHCVFVGHV